MQERVSATEGRRRPRKPEEQLHEVPFIPCLSVAFRGKMQLASDQPRKAADGHGNLNNNLRNMLFSVSLRGLPWQNSSKRASVTASRETPPMPASGFRSFAKIRWRTGAFRWSVAILALGRNTGCIAVSKAV